MTNLNLTNLTKKELEIAYSRASILGEGEVCDTIIKELDGRK